MITMDVDLGYLERIRSREAQAEIDKEIGARIREFDLEAGDIVREYFTAGPPPKEAPPISAPEISAAPEAPRPRYWWDDSDDDEE